MDIPGLDATVQPLFSAGLAPSTRRNYQSGSRRYLSFCEQYDFHPFPTTESTLTRFVAFLFESQLTGATVKNYLAVVRHAQIALGLEYVVKGFKRSATYTSNRTRLLITPDNLHQLKMVWQGWQCRRDSSMLWAAAIMCFCGFRRSGELVVPSQSAYDPSVHLSYSDVMVDLWSKFRLKASKTDPFGCLCLFGHHRWE